MNKVIIKLFIACMGTIKQNFGKVMVINKVNDDNFYLEFGGKVLAKRKVQKLLPTTFCIRC